MAGLTQSHEVTRFITSALGEREDVVYLFSGSERSLLLALLAKRVCLDVTVSDALPSTPVSFIRRRVTFVLVVVFVYLFLMFGTVLLAHSKPTAAGISAGTLWFVWHRFTSSG